MTETSRFPLTTKILLLVALNVALLLVVAVVFFRLQLREDFGSLLLATARERILSTTRLLALELSETPVAERDELLARYSSTYHAKFLLFDGDHQIAGPHTVVPPRVVERMRRRLESGAPPQGAPNGPGRFFSGPPWRPYLLLSRDPLTYWVVLRIPYRDPQTHAFSRLTLVLASPTLFSNSFFFDWKPWASITGAALFLSVLCWLPLVRGLTRSIRQMMHATSQIANGQFDTRVDCRRRDELGSLGASINGMAARLSAYVHGQKRFLADIAHELRSPLARMQVALGILERRCEGNAGEYVSDLQEEVETMSRLTDELLAYAKAATKPEAVRLEPVPMAEVVREAARVEGRAGAAIEIDADETLMAMATHEYLLRAVANLIRNAVRYAGEAGPIRVSMRKEGGEVVLTVADSGPGVPEEALAKIFTPFYRVEEARDRRSGGTGLGLAIVGSCVEACRGSVKARNATPSGLEVTIRLPAA